MRLRSFNHDECRVLRALDPKYWTVERLSGHYKVGVRSIERAISPNDRRGLLKAGARP
jgi:hypothetical protein